MVQEASIASRIFLRANGFQRSVRYGFYCDSSRRSLAFRQNHAGASPTTRKMMMWSCSERHVSSSGLRATIPLLRPSKPRLASRFFVSSSSDGAIGSTNSVEVDATVIATTGGGHSVRDYDKNLSSSSSFKVSRVSYDGTMYVCSSDSSFCV
jgi:hypothetical protein